MCLQKLVLAHNPSTNMKKYTLYIIIQSIDKHKSLTVYFYPSFVSSSTTFDAQRNCYKKTFDRNRLSVKLIKSDLCLVHLMRSDRDKENYTSMLNNCYEVVSKIRWINWELVCFKKIIDYNCEIVIDAASW